MLSFLTEFNLALGGAAVTFVLGVVFADRVKDYFKGVPSQARAALKGLEKDTLDKIKVAQAEVLARLPLPVATIEKVAIPAPVLPPVVAVAPAAPVAQTPAPEPVAAPAAPAAPAV